MKTVRTSRPKVCSVCLVSAVLGMVTFAGPAGAEDQTEEYAGDLEEVFVTGTRITRREFTAPSPVSTLTREAILTTAQPNLEEALNRMPQVAPDFGRTSNNPGNGKAGVNLRGLGSNRTLVMLNGRRLAPAGLSSQVDVNTLPQSLIERVEIVTGGATTVYGSDAVSGVVNFITRDDFDGIEIEASAYMTEEGDSEIYDINLSWGSNFADGDGNITLFAGYLDREPMFAGNRDISRQPLRDNWQGEIVPTGSSSIPGGLIINGPVDLGNGPALVTFTPEGLPRPFVDPDDRYNFAPLNYLQIPLERHYAGLFLDYQVNDQLETYAEFLYTHNEVQRTLAPIAAQLRATVNIDNPELTEETRQVLTDNFTPPGSDLAQIIFFRRLEELGSRITNNESDYTRLVGGLRGDLSDTWSWDAWVTYTENDEDERLLNDASRSRFLQGLLVDPATGQCFDPSGGCVPVNPFGVGLLSTDAIDYISLAPYTNRISRTQKLASAYISGAPFEGWAGPISVAIGAEWREDEGSFTVDEALFSGDALGFFPDSGVVGKESVSEVYVEALIPLASGLAFAHSAELEIGGRLSEYRNAGSTDSWKVGGTWEPLPEVRFRAMYQQSVRAPNLVEAFQEQVIIENSFTSPNTPDPCSASQDPVGRGVAERCIAQGIPASLIGVYEHTTLFPTDFVFGGNPELTPENGTTLTVGIVYEGLDNWLFALDYFDLSIEDTIGSPDSAFVCFAPNNPGGALCERITRDSQNYNVIRVNDTTSNLGRLETQGFDLQANYVAALPDSLGIGDSGADISVDFIWTHLMTLSFQDSPAVEPIDCAGTFGDPCNISNVGYTSPENKLSVFAAYTSGDFTANMTWRWLDSTDSNVGIFAPSRGVIDPVISIPTVPSKTYVDLGLGYRFSDHVRARLTVANLLDTSPPQMANTVFANNTDAATFDVFGRSYQLALFISL